MRGKNLSPFDSVRINLTDFPIAERRSQNVQSSPRKNTFNYILLLIFFINFKYHWFIYLLVTIFALIINSNNIFIQWILMEFGTIIRIRLINIKSTNKIPRLIYYIISVFFRIFLFFIIILYLSSIRFIKTDIFNFIVQIIFFLKIGTFPFHFWIIVIQFSYR